jgi:GR25 family glycosyltransferase involved in LPS biosynthesis
MKISLKWVTTAILATMIAVAVFYCIPTHPTLDTIHVLNLDKDVKRWQTMEANGTRLGLPLQRFPGFNGRVLTQHTVHPLGVGRAMIRPNRKDKEGKHLVNLGLVGCFVAHRNLLTHLSTLPYSDSAGHMILEDDITLPDDFMSRWAAVAARVPGSYDIVQCGLWHPLGTEVAPGILRLRTDPTKRVNLGAFCYVVRHGALRTKILPWLRYMVDAYDEQLALKYGEWESYGVQPNLVTVNEDVGESSINQINEQT